MLSKISRKLFIFVFFTFFVFSSKNPIYALTTINTCGELQNINNDLDEDYQLGVDINCSSITNFVSIGSSETPFTGTFDGKDFTISNLNINKPENDYIALFGFTNGTNISNINVGGTIIGNDFVGGLVGYGTGTTISDSIFNGNITANFRVGGLVGYDSDIISISNSHTSGTITGLSRMGGLLGSAENRVDISNSYNESSITSTGSRDTSYEGIGGLVGVSWKITILQSYNTGNIANTDGYMYVGGLLGGGGLVNIQESYNTGDIDVKININGEYNGAGGIVGSGINVTINNCYNTGDLNFENLGEWNAPSVGGILGFAFISSLKNSYNSGEISQEENNADGFIGGILGYLYFNNSTYGNAIYPHQSTFVDTKELILHFINNFNIGNIIKFGETITGGLIGGIEIENDSPGDFNISNNWWSRDIGVTNAIGYINIGDTASVENEVIGQHESESLMDSFKTYTHKVYDTDPKWDFSTIWSNVYAGTDYPILAFQNLLEVSPTPTPTTAPSNNNSSNNNSSPPTYSCTNSKPIGISDIFQINTTNKSAKIFFTPLSDTNQYYISFSEQPNAEKHGEQVTLLREGVQSHTIYFLKPNTTYYVKVRGQNGCMPGDWSNIMKFKTNSKNQINQKIFYKYINFLKNIISPFQKF